jgi:hypothetical protein
MKHLFVTGGRTWFVYLVRKLPIVTSNGFFCPHHNFFYNSVDIRRYPVRILAGILAVFRLSFFLRLLASTAIVARLATAA